MFVCPEGRYIEADSSKVRAVLLPDPSFAVTASRDGTTRVWKQISDSLPTYDPSESSHGAQYKTCLAYAPSTKEYPDGLIISSGQDGLIEARQPATTAEANADGFMVGHSNQVCSLDVGPNGDWIISGSWDSSARSWQISRWETEVEFVGHTATVWAVIAYDKDTVITGCADKGIRIFDLRGKLRHGWENKDVVRALVKLPDGHATGANFASASNDGAIRLWTLKGDLIGECWGHEAFIYSLDVLPSGEIISSGEDRSVRVWKGTECIQVITLPAISVWSVAAGPHGDIIAGSSDKLARIFTRDPSRQASAEVLQEFNESLQSSAVPAQQMDKQLNMQDMPGPEFLTQKSGTKEGQSAIIKDTDGSPTLYQWSMSQQSWIKIGVVVDSAGSSGQKKEHGGKEYDYVFDIDIEDGKPALKLPFNVTQNPYDAARKFLEDHELPMTYLEETANFIVKNTQGATLGQSTASQGADAWGTENRYRPGEVPQSNYQPKPAAPSQPLPQKQYLSIVMGKPVTAYEQIAKKNADYGETDAALSQSELKALSATAQQLAKYDFSKPSTLEPSKDLNTALPSLIKAATQWQPPNNRLAPLDLLRFLAVSLKSLPSAGDDAIDPIAAILGSDIFEESSIGANSKLVMMSIRLFSNLLCGAGKALVDEHLDAIIDSLKPASKAAQNDNNIAVALTTLYVNMAVLLSSSKEHEVAVARGFQILEEINQLLASFPAVNHSAGAAPAGQSTEPAYRALVALGTVIVGLQHPDIKEAAKMMDVPASLGQLQTKQYLREPRFQALASQIRSSL
jgi:phospholipase A-2-activating protein